MNYAQSILETYNCGAIVTVTASYAIAQRLTRLGSADHEFDPHRILDNALTSRYHFVYRDDIGCNIVSDNDILLAESRSLNALTDRNRLHRLSQFVKWLDNNRLRWHEVRTATIEKYVDYLEQQRRLAPASVYAHVSTIRVRYDELARMGITIPHFQPPITPWAPAYKASELPKIPTSGFLDQFSRLPGLNRQANSTWPERPFYGPSVLWELVTSRIVSQIKQQAASGYIWLTVHQANALLASPGMDTLHGLRDTAIIAIMLCTGVRESEIRQLDVSDLHEVIDGNVPALHVPDKQGCVERWIPFGDMMDARDVAQDWLEATEITEGPLFRGLYKGGQSVRATRISTRAINQILGSYPLQTEHGPLKVTSLVLRRTYARLLYKQGVRVNVIQQYLGLGSIDTTIDYIGLSAEDDLDDIPPSLYSSL